MTYIRKYQLSLIIAAIFFAIGSGRDSLSMEDSGFSGTPSMDDRILAVVYPLKTATLSTEVSGLIRDIHFEMGTVFQKGDILVELDASRYLAAKQKADAVLASAKAAYKTNRELYGQRSVSEVEFAKVKADLNIAKANLAIAKKDLASCSIRAPYRGRIVKSLVNENELVQQGQPLIAIVDDRIMRAKFMAPSDYYSRITVGQTFTLQVRGVRQSYRCKVTHVSPVLESNTSTFQVFAEIDNPGNILRGGMTGLIMLGAVAEVEKGTPLDRDPMIFPQQIVSSSSPKTDGPLEDATVVPGPDANREQEPDLSEETEQTLDHSLETRPEQDEPVLEVESETNQAYVQAGGPTDHQAGTGQGEDAMDDIETPYIPYSLQSPALRPLKRSKASTLHYKKSVGLGRSLLANATAVASVEPLEINPDNISGPGVKKAEPAKAIETKRKQISENIQKVVEKDDRFPYTLHLSSWKQLKKVRKQLAHYRNQGHAPFAIRVESKKGETWWGIYMGHYKTKEEAAVAKEKLNLPGAIVKKKNFANLIGSYATEKAMRNMAGKLDALGYFSHFIEGGDNDYRLFTGAFYSRKTAEEQNADLKSHGIEAQVSSISIIDKNTPPSRIPKDLREGE